MRIHRAHTTEAAELNERIREAFTSRTIDHCGVADLPPGHVAHAGEVHTHEIPEVFVILAGEVTVPITGGPTDVARAGDVVVIDPGEEHHLTNPYPLTARVIYMMTD